MGRLPTPRPPNQLDTLFPDSSPDCRGEVEAYTGCYSCRVGVAVMPAWEQSGNNSGTIRISTGCFPFKSALFGLAKLLKSRQ